MSLSPTSGSQVILAGTILAATVATHYASAAPSPNPEAGPPAGFANEHIGKLVSLPYVLPALHAYCLAASYPAVPPSLLLRHGAANGVNTGLITWSAATAVPLALLAVGAVTRLGAYRTLGRDFTFKLAAPDRLVTAELYRYIQHPGYTGVTLVLLGNASLYLRSDGVLACWVPPRWYAPLGRLMWALAPVAVLVWALIVRARVRNEERMLRARFGGEWERWHARTARFIPWLF